MSLPLNTESVRQGQVSPGDLKKEANLLKYAMLGYKMAKVKVEEIQHFDLIPDYAVPTAATVPIVVVSPDGAFCLDGWDMVIEAREKKRKSIPCEVEVMAEHSHEELCIRKTSIRAITRGGYATYMEICRNSAITLELLNASGEDLIFYSHGGRRVKDNLKDDKIDAMHILAVRLGRDKGTISGHLSHVKWISPAAMQVFVEQNAGKRFFEKTQTKKQNRLRVLEGENKSPEEILEQVSTLMLEEWKKFKEKRAASPAPEATPTEASPVTDPDVMQVEEEPADTDDADLDETDDEAPASDGGQPETTTANTVRRLFHSVSERIAEKDSDDTPIEEIEACVLAQVDALMEVLDAITHLKNAQASRV